MKQTWLNKLNYRLYFLWQRVTQRKFRTLRKLRICDDVTTVNKIVTERCSMSRFGDGELKLLTGKDTDFQQANDEICCKLRTILHDDNEGLLVGLPYTWHELGKLKYRAYEFWSSYLARELDSTILPAVNLNKQYYDSIFTRFYIDYKSPEHARRLIPLIKKIWQDRHVCIVEGKYSRLGVGNDFFDNAASVSRILCPPTNAFSVYNQILAEVSKQPRETLVLLALGMTATCAAYDIHKLGYQAVDVGHVDIEYEWFRMGAKDKVPVKNKYVAEAGRLSGEIDLQDEKYKSQIIADLS